MDDNFILHTQPLTSFSFSNSSFGMVYFVVCCWELEDLDSFSFLGLRKKKSLFSTVYESNTKEINFWIMFICFTFVKCSYFVLYSISVRFDLVKSPEVTLCG